MQANTHYKLNNIKFKHTQTIKQICKPKKNSSMQRKKTNLLHKFSF